MDLSRTVLGLLAQILVLRDALSVAVLEVRLSSSKTYVLQGESATLVCHYTIDPSKENVTEVSWERDGELVYTWSSQDPPLASGVLKDNVDISPSSISPSTLTITSVHMDMQGTYTCRVRTNGKTAHNDMYLMVIVNACNESAWKTHSDMIECTEDLSMHCVGIFPKPSPACGIYSEKTGKYLSSMPLDSVNMLHNGTFEVSFNRRFSVKDWLGQPGIKFRCYMIVLGTNWRFGIDHHLFGQAGCEKDPPKVLKGYFNVSGTRSCWGYPSEGSKAEYHCEEGYHMSGTALYVCSKGEWVPEGVIVRADGLHLPICGSESGVSSLACSWVALVFIVLLQLRTFRSTPVLSAVG